MNKLLTFVLAASPYSGHTAANVLKLAGAALDAGRLRHGGWGVRVHQLAEAISHAGGALGKGWGVVLAFMGARVYTALPGQSPPAGEWISLSQALAELSGDRALIF